MGADQASTTVDFVSNISRRNHTVPAFYLERFAQAGKIITVKLPGDIRRPQSVKNVSVVNNFYVMKDAESPDVFERALSELEGDAAKVLARLLDEKVWPLPTEDRGLLAYFAAVQYVRGPERRRGMEETAAIMTQMEITYGGRENVANWIERKHGFVPSEEVAERVWSEATRPGGPPIKLTSRAHIEQILNVSEEIFKYFLGRIWILVEFERRSLYTSDAPISLIPHPEDNDDAIGLLTAWAVAFPISRRAAILMVDPLPFIEKGLTLEMAAEGRMDWRDHGTTRYQKLINHATLSWSRAWLYHHPEDAAVIPDELPEPRLVEFETSGSNFATVEES